MRQAFLQTRNNDSSTVDNEGQKDEIDINGGHYHRLCNFLTGRWRKSATVASPYMQVIAQLYLETVVRYVRFVEQRPQYIPAVLSVFLDARGVHHPDAGVRR